jgi:hypothetical protein
MKSLYAAVLVLILPYSVVAYPFMVGARLSTPQIVSVSLTWRPNSFWLLQVEPGVGGCKTVLGLGGSFGYIFGMALKSSLLYTWGKTIGYVETGQTYAGEKER